MKRTFPGKPVALVRHQIDTEYWSPTLNPMSRDILGDLDDESKMLVITLGSNEKRKRLDFVRRLISSLPEEVSKDINLIHVGSDVKLSDDQLLAHCKMQRYSYSPAHAKDLGTHLPRRWSLDVRYSPPTCPHIMR